MTPDYAKKPLRLYAGSMPPLAPAGADVIEVDVIGNARPVAFRDPPPPAGFAVASRKITPMDDAELEYVFQATQGS